MGHASTTAGGGCDAADASLAHRGCSLIWRAEVQAVGGGLSGLSPLQDLLLRSVTAALTGAEDLPEPLPITPEEFGHALERRNAAFRERVCQVMALGALVRRPPDPAAMLRVHEFCEELSISGQVR